MRDAIYGTTEQKRDCTYQYGCRASEIFSEIFLIRKAGDDSNYYRLAHLLKSGFIMPLTAQAGYFIKIKVASFRSGFNYVCFVDKQNLIIYNI